MQYLQGPGNRPPEENPYVKNLDCGSRRILMNCGISGIASGCYTMVGIFNLWRGLKAFFTL
jgi:hypothetical protein